MSLLELQLPKDFDERFREFVQKNLKNLDRGSTQIGIFFDEKTGRGYANGKTFKLQKSKTPYKIFEAIYQNFNNPLHKEKVISLMGISDKSDSTQMYSINQAAKDLRTRTGLGTNAIVLNFGEISLVGEKLSNLPQTSPKDT